MQDIYGWALGGMVNDDGSLLGRVPERYHGIWVPPLVVLDAGSLLFSEPGHGNDPARWGWARAHGRTDQLLDAFASLAPKPDAAILTFAKQWGPIYPCYIHPGRCFWTPYQRHLVADQCQWVMPEPLVIWRGISEMFAGILSVAACLHQEEPAPATTWVKAYGGSEESAAIMARLTQAEQKAALARWVNLLAEMFIKAPSLSVENDLSLSLGAGFGFLPAAWKALVQTVTRRSGVYICDNCNRAYGREDRKPQSGRLNFCKQCGKAAAKKLWRQRKIESIPTEQGARNDTARASRGQHLSARRRPMGSSPSPRRG